MKYHIIGIHKCGSNSLQHYLKARGIWTKKQESLFWKYPTTWSPEPGYRAAFILRDPIDRIWSHFHYKRQDHQQKWDDAINPLWSFAEALEKDPYLVAHSKYDEILKKWRHLNPQIFFLEELQKNGNFPHMLRNDHPMMTSAEKQLAEKYLFNS